MEVDAEGGDELLLAPDPAEEDALMAGSALGKDDVDQLLHEEEEDLSQVKLEDEQVPEGVVKEEVEDEQVSEAQQADANSSEDERKHQGSGGYRGGYRGRGRYFRGPMGLMPHPGRGGYFPGPRGPPFMRGPPPFMRPPVGFRGPPRHPMMRGPPGFRMFPPRGPMGPRGPRPMHRTPVVREVTTTSTTTAKSSSSGPTPLMSIETPVQVKAVVNQKIQRERAHEIAQKQEVQRRRMAVEEAQGSGVRGVKRSYTQHIGGGPSTSIHGEPQHKYQAAQSGAAGTSSATPSTVVRSNLRQIQCVDEPMPAAKPIVTPPQVSYPPRRNPQSNLITLTHNPSPNTITINPVQTLPQHRQQQQQQHNGNLVPVPAGRPPAAPRPARVPGCRVLITNLPSTATFDRLSQMASPCGNVRTIQFENDRAVIAFAEAASAEKFYKTNNRKMMDLSIITVARLA